MMKAKTKRVLLVILITALISLSILLVILNLIVGNNILQNNAKDYTPEKVKEEQLKLSVWRYQTELEYLDQYCEIEELLPPNTATASTIDIEVDYYEKPMEIATIYNPYPNYSTVYEMGIVTTSESADIDTSNLKVRLYRIELIENPKVNLEYITHLEIPHFYIVQKSDNSEFLLYPQILKYKDILDKGAFVKIL